MKVFVTLAALTLALSASAGAQEASYQSGFLVGAPSSEALPAAVVAGPALINGVLATFKPLTGTPCFNCVVPTNAKVKAAYTLGLSQPTYSIPATWTSVGAVSYFTSNYSGTCTLSVTGSALGTTIPVFTVKLTVAPGKVYAYYHTLPRYPYHGISASFQSVYKCGTATSNTATQTVYLQ